MKYIAWDGPLFNEAVIFTSLDHKTMQQLLQIKDEDILGAGFVKFDEDNGVYCTGHSHTMQVKSRGDADTKLVRQLMSMTTG